MTAFAPGSISFRLYPHALPADVQLQEMMAQASLVAEAGFDGIMVSERHGGIVGNVPNPIQVTGWLAERMSRGWVAPCPVLALLRPPTLIVEEIAWLAARYPGRVGVGLGTGGGHELDFRLYDAERDRLAERFEPVLRFVATHLSGTADDELARDFAVARCKDAPVPIISAVMSPAAARRAARCGVGTIGSSLTTLDRERRLSEVYRSAGGSGPEVLIRHVWLGKPPREAIAAKQAEYRQTSGSGGARFWGADEIITSEDASVIAERLKDALVFTGKTCLHLRVHVPDISPQQAREQVQLLGKHVLPLLRRGQRY